MCGGRSKAVELQAVNAVKECAMVASAGERREGRARAVMMHLIGRRRLVVMCNHR